MPTLPEESIAHTLLSRNETLAGCEITSGGLVSARLIALPGASTWYRGGVIPYTPLSKLHLLGITHEETKRYGAVSPESALLLAHAVRKKTGADWAFAETAIAPPQNPSARSKKAVGSGFLAIVSSTHERAIPFSLSDNGRQTFMHGLADFILQTLHQTVSESSS